MENQIGALMLTIIDMTIVFAVLFLLAGVIQVIKVLNYKRDGTKAEKKTEALGSVNPGIKVPGGARDVKPAMAGDTPLKVAAACAAVAAYLEGAPYRIVSIRKMTSLSLWVQAARMENISSGEIQRHRR
ncbi:OadG family protein [Moorella sulfitireducens (nom. illeg.)]|uniref:OadG family protein n=1 Tax=Neomoorella sulfitireducens TaxID=2972948 RepID=UPI0021ACF30C|nr:OadG family protein [Moorella sulfitireducens]